MGTTTQLKSKSTLSVNDLTMKGCYNEAIVLAKKRLRQLPRLPNIDGWVKDYSRHWYLAHLCSAYYEKRDYKTALRWGKKAMEINPYCPMVLWYYAGPLIQFDNMAEAICCYHSIYDRGLKKLAYGMCGEGMEKALQMRSDVRIRLAECYHSINDLNNALKWGKLFLRYFHKGGLEKRNLGKKLVIRCKKEIEDGHKGREIERSNKVG